MPESKRPLKVFLCHAHADRDAVRALYTRLTNDGVDAWLDKEKLLPGQDWKFEIENAVHEADVVVVCLSKQFNLEGFRQREVRWALDKAMEKPEGEIFIIPARLEECNMLKSLAKWHWVNLFEKDGYEWLLRSLQARAKTVNAILLSSRVSTIEEVKTRAVEFERNGDYSKAIREYKVLKKLSPGYSGLDEKIAELQKRLQSQNMGSVKVFVRKLNPLFRIIGIIGIIIVLSWVGSWVIPKVPLFVSTKKPSSTTPFTPTFISLPNEVIDKGVSMALVPAGDFTMGSNYGNDTKPVDRISLDSFYIDKYEVTNELYKLCVNSRGCISPKRISSKTRSYYYGYPEFDKFPVIYVDWNMARTYCEWRGARLPTEAEWEKAARGPGLRTYPWGDQIDCDKANYAGCIGDTVEVDSYPNGKSFYGVFNMAGNVSEWVSSLYTSYPYALDVNHENLDSVGNRVFRGGSFNDVGSSVSAFYRNKISPTYTYYSIGFRCAKDAP